MRSLVCGLHEAGATAADDIATHPGQFGGEFLDSVISWRARLEARGAKDRNTIILASGAANTRQFVDHFLQARHGAFKEFDRCIFIAEANDVGLSKGGFSLAHVIIGSVGTADSEHLNALFIVALRC